MKTDPTRKSVLVLTPLFGPGVRSSPLANDLVGALLKAGHDVHVIVLDWSGQAGGLDERYRTKDGALVDVIAPPRVKLFNSGLDRVARQALGLIKGFFRARRASRGRRYDCIFAFTIASALLGPLLATMRRAHARLLYVTDFFPYHNVAIGTYPSGPAFRLARTTETFAMRRFDALLCMSAEGVRFLRENYALRAAQETRILPLWTSAALVSPGERDAIRRHYELPIDRQVAIFGGTLQPGRGIDVIIEAANRSHDELPDLFFLFVGSGSFEKIVLDAEILEPQRIKLIPGLPHEEYLKLLAACDIGLISLVAGVRAPAFPSKTLDYLRAGLPIVAAVEPSSDFFKLLPSLNIGRAVPVGDVDAMIDALRWAVDNQGSANFRDAARHVLENHFSVKRATEIIVSEGGT